MVKISQRSPSQHQDPALLNDQQATVQDTLCQTTSKTGTQPHPLTQPYPLGTDTKNNGKYKPAACERETPNTGN